MPGVGAMGEYAYCQWIGCEAFLGAIQVTDTDCRSQSDLGQISAELYRQHLIMGATGSRQGVYIRVTPQNINLRVCDETGGGGDERNEEFAIPSIARCTVGHDPFPQVVLVVQCVGMRAPDFNSTPDVRSCPLDMRCHGIACRDGAEASCVAKIIARAFHDSRRLAQSQIAPNTVRDVRGAYPDTHAPRNVVNIHSVDDTHRYANVELTRFSVSGAVASAGAQRLAPLDPISGRKPATKGLTEVGGW